LQNSLLRSLESKVCSMLLKTEIYKRRSSHMLLIVFRDLLKLFLLLKSRLDRDHIILLSQFYHLQHYQLQQHYNRLSHQLKNLKRSFSKLQIAGPKLHNQFHLFQQEIKCFFFQLKRMTKTKEVVGNL
jgi:hypothetical protein